MSMMGGEQNNFVSRSAHHYSVDCARANNGLFTGILVMVFTIILLIVSRQKHLLFASNLLILCCFQVFFVLINNENEALHNAAILVASVTELALYTITTIAVVVGMIQVRLTKWQTQLQHLHYILNIFFVPAMPQNSPCLADPWPVV